MKNFINTWASHFLRICSGAITLIVRKKVPPTEHPLFLGNIPLKNETFHKHLGITFSADMQWSHHIDCKTSHAYKRTTMMRFFKYKWSTFCLSTCYKSFAPPVLEYGDIVYSNCKKADAAKLESVENDALRIIAGAKRFTSFLYYLGRLVSKHWKRVEMHIAWFYFANACTTKYHNTWLTVCQNVCILVIPVRQLLQHFVL